MNLITQKAFSLKHPLKRFRVVKSFSLKNPKYSFIRPFISSRSYSFKRYINSKTISQFHPSFIRHYSTVKPFKLADIGEGIAEVEILNWFVKVGDKVDEFDPICEVQSDKATVEIKSPYAGVIKSLKYEVSDMAKVGSVLCDIEVESSQVEESSPEVDEVKIETPKQQKSEEVFDNILSKGRKLKVLATPAVRHLVKKNNIDITQIKGSGKDGRVTKGDVIAFLERKTTTTEEREIPQPTPTVQKTYVPGETKVVKLKGYARAMAKKMEESLQIPHFGYCDEIVMDELIKLREQLKPHFEKRGVRLTYLSFIIKICSLALKEYPILNSSINKELTEITYHGSHNIGIAVDTPTGLVVPNIKNVQDLSIFEIAQELQRIMELAKLNKLSPQDLSGGTFTLSNIGTIGGTYAKPVVVSPEVCIGALGKIQKVPRFDENGNVVPVHIMQFSWSADHRAVDGASMASFSNKVKQYIENPGFIIMDTK